MWSYELVFHEWVIICDYHKKSFLEPLEPTITCGEFGTTFGPSSSRWSHWWSVGQLGCIQLDGFKTDLHKALAWKSVFFFCFFFFWCFFWNPENLFRGALLTWELRNCIWEIDNVYPQHTPYYPLHRKLWLPGDPPTSCVNGSPLLNSQTMIYTLWLWVS